ncbi:MAG: translocation/assembly module TamB [Prevotella sp.]|jgi:hypothetical protein|nr:translocation/assembly module TamB [Prevotella sp.]
MEETKEVKKVEKKNKSWFRRIVKILLSVIVGIVLLNVLLFVLLSIPSVQQKAADFAVGILKDKLKTEISIDEVRLKLFNHVTLHGIYIEDQARDTLLYANYLDVTLSPWEFIKSSKLQITGIDIDDFFINVNKQDSISDFNFQFVINAFASTDTTSTDTTKSALTVVIEDINLKNGRLNYDVLSDTITPGLFNASHISLYDFNANVDLNSIDSEKFDIALNNLSAKELSGTEIRNIKGRLYSEGPQLWVENLLLELPNSHLKTNTVRYNLDTDDFEINTDDTEIEPGDLVAFLPNMKFLTNKISLNADITGTLPAVRVNHINLTYGNDLILNGNAGIASYERYGSSDVVLFIDQFKATPQAVTSIARLGDSTFVAPDILRELGDLFLKGNITGRLDQFKLTADAWCKYGTINMRASGGTDTTFTNLNVIANLNTRNFNLRKIVGDSTGIGRVSANIDLRAQQTRTQSLSAQVQGAINSLEIREDTLKNLPFKGYYNAAKMGLTAKADWRIGKIYLDASMTQAKVPDIDVYLRMDSVHVDRFYKNETWVNPRLTMVLKGNIKGLDIDNITGIATIDSLDFHADNFNFQPGKFILEAGKEENNDKFISLKSSLLTANITGQYSFATIGDEFTSLMNSYLPDLFQLPVKRRIRTNENNFNFSLTANNTEQLGRIFKLPVDIIKPASISGLVNTIDKNLSVKANIPHVRYGAYNIENTTLNVANADSTFNISGGTDAHIDNGTYKLLLLVNGANDSIHASANISSGKTDINLNGKIEAGARFSRSEENDLVTSLNIYPTDLMVGKLPVSFLAAQIINSGNRTEVQNFGLAVNKQRYFGADGVISDQPADSLKAYFDNAQIGDILEAFDVKDIRGNIDGNILLTNILNQPELYTEAFRIADIIIYGDTLGTMNLQSEWSDDFGGARLNATLDKLDQNLAELDGTIYTSQDSLDLQLRLVEMPLRWAQPLASGFLNKLDGNLSTNVIIEGKTSAPRLRGFLGFNDTQIGIDYTNVTYTISDTISISPDRIGFDNLTLKDPQGNSATANATVTHHDFTNMKYSLDMQMNNLMVLNTRDRVDSLFYGRVFVSGNVKINGDDNGININMQVRNNKNSDLNILLPQTSQASDYQSIVYINVPEDKLEAEKVQTPIAVEKSMPIKLNVKIDVTPDVALGVIINPATNDALQAKGAGSINFAYDMQTENMSTYGDYTLSDGNVKLNIQNLKKLEFKIQQGSKLFFTGDPMNTRFDITAYRRVRAELKSLDVSFDSDNYPSKVDVDCILHISGNIDKMDVSYDISLPTASDDLRARINSFISTDEQKNLQFASLVAQGSFYSSSGTGGFNVNQLWTGLASSALSQGLTALVGNMLGNEWQIGANIESGDGSFSDVDMSVNVSRSFWDNKLKLSTNLGYRADQTTAGDEFVGDFDLEYQLNSMWTLRGYSHTNERYYQQAPTTQGVGIVYSKEAPTLKRLFQSFKPRILGSRSQQETQTTVTPLSSDSLRSDSIKTEISQQQPAIINEEKEQKNDK